MMRILLSQPWMRGIQSSMTHYSLYRGVNTSANVLLNGSQHSIAAFSTDTQGPTQGPLAGIKARCLLLTCLQLLTIFVII